MTAKSKRKQETIQFLSPLGIARFPKISNPDVGGEYSDGKFKTGIVFEGAALEKVREAQAAAAKKLWPGKALTELALPVREFFDKDRENAGAKISAGYGFNAKSKLRPAIFDARRQPLPDGVKIGGGTEMRIGAAFSPYTSTEKVRTKHADGSMTVEEVVVNGINVYLNSVQVKTLRQGGGISDGSEFDEIEGGYEYEAPSDAPISDATNL